MEEKSLKLFDPELIEARTDILDFMIDVYAKKGQEMSAGVKQDFQLGLLLMDQRVVDKAKQK